MPGRSNSFLILPGGSLILYTDGVTDASAAGGENFGAERLRRTLEVNGRSGSEDICATILDEVRKFSQDGDYQDDVTVVVLHRD